MFSCEFCKIFKNIFFTEHLRTTAPVYLIVANLIEDKLVKDYGTKVRIIDFYFVNNVIAMSEQDRAVYCKRERNENS